MFKNILIAAALLVSIPAAAQSAMPSDRAILPAGQFVWQPELSPYGQIRVSINVATQMAYVYRAETLIGVSNISTGKSGHETPTGSYTISSKETLHRSKEYDGAPMPFAQFFIPTRGIALHAGVTPGYAASHGCVRLPKAFAQLLFSETTTGDIVEIVDNDPDLDISL